jgi:hypothetical protein
MFSSRGLYSVFDKSEAEEISLFSQSQEPRRRQLDRLTALKHRAHNVRRQISLKAYRRRRRTHISHARNPTHSRRNNSDKAFFAAAALPIRDYEMALELIYQAPIVPGWVVQPDFQYIFHPRYGAIDPTNSIVGRIRDAAVLGLHTAIKF